MLIRLLNYHQQLYDYLSARVKIYDKIRYRNDNLLIIS